MAEPRVRACHPPRMAVLVDGHEIAVAPSGASQDRTDTVLEHRRTKEITITRGGCMSDNTHRALAWIRVPRNTDAVQDSHIEHALLIPHEQADREEAERRLRALRAASTVSWPKPAPPTVSPPRPVLLAGYEPATAVGTEEIERVEQFAAEQGFAMEPWQRGWLWRALDRVLGGGR